MALNFCVAHHLASISSSKVATDGYEATNLISSDERCRRRGFLAASFISPPVDIVVSFPHPINISHVALRLSNGSQQTSAVKLYTKVSNDGPFHLIGGKNIITEPEIYFYNNRYKVTYLFSTFSYALPRTQRLYPQLDAHICSVHELKICLMKTARSSLPALSKLEVWGQPASNCSEVVKHGIFQRELSTRASLRELSQHSKSLDNSSNDSVEETVVNQTEIPEEFLDSITCELMSQPVLLPSGNNVDRLTLEKYIETSSTWGRLPGDPFTGVAFSKTSQPIPNVELKTRIDQFWLTNPESCSGGRCISFTSRSMKKFTHAANSFSKNKFSTISQAQSKPELSYKCKSLKRKHCDLETFSSAIPTTKKIPRLETSVEHAKELAVSLKSSLKRALDGRPSFLNPTSHCSVEETRNCIECNKANESRLYSLPCSHYLCRTCLLKQPDQKFQCKKCSISFASSDISCCYE